MRISILMFVTICMLFIACRSHKQIIHDELKEENEELLGKHCDELLKIRGVPDYKETLSTGEEVWTYRSTKTGEKKGVIMSVGNAPAKRPTTSWNENINFIVGKNKIIKEIIIKVE
jgi:hypothetical protein